jgi:biotin carboxyl carrier protein
MIALARAGERVSRVEVRVFEDRYRVAIDDRALHVDVRDCGPGFLSLLVDGTSHDVALERVKEGFAVTVDGTRTIVALGPTVPAGVAPHHGVAPVVRLLAPMPGKILRTLVPAGSTVEAGQGLVVMEAMKMENELRAPRAGTVREVHVKEGQTVETGALLAVVE